MPNPWANVVMHSEVALWGKSQFGASQFELTVKLSQVAEYHLFEFDYRSDASCFYVVLSRQGMYSTKQYHEEQQCKPHHRLFHELLKRSDGILKPPGPAPQTTTGIVPPQRGILEGDARRCRLLRELEDYRHDELILVARLRNDQHR